MSGWGTLDNLAATGTVTVVSGSATVTGSGTAFTSNIKAGDSVTIASNKYRVTNVGNATSLSIDPVSATSTSGAKAYVQQGPKFVQNTAAENVYSIQNIYGISADEAGVPENKARNINQPGWAHYLTYVDAHGQTRYKTETLVAMSKNFNENSAGTLQTDAADDTVAADYLIYFTLQPTDGSGGGNASAAVTLTTDAVSSPAGASLTYQWKKAHNATSTFTNVSGTGFTGATSNTLVIARAGNVNGNVFKLVVSATGTGADDNTSSVVSVTTA